MANRYNPPTRINGVRTAPFGAIMSGLQLGKMVGDMMSDTNAGNTLKGVFDPLSNVGAGISYMSEGKIGKGLLSLIPGVGTYLQGKDANEREAEIKAITEAKAKAGYIDNMRGESINDLNNYTPTNQVSMYPGGGKIGSNPIPNKYIVIKSKAIKYVNGEPTTHFIDKYDTLVGQDYGYWGENLQGVNVPPAFDVDANGKVILPKKTKVMPNGGRLNSQNLTHLPMGGREDFSPVSGDPMTQGATTITTPAGSTAGHHETGQNIPVLDANGNPVAIGEPGEVVVDDLIISKRNGLAQKYIAIDKQKQNLLAKIDKAKTPEARAGLTRSIAFYDKQLENIKAEQEQLATQQPQQGQLPVADGGLSNLGGNDPKGEINFGTTNYGWNAGIMPTPDFTNIPQYKINGDTNPLSSLTSLDVQNVDLTDYNKPFDWKGGIDKATQIGAMILPSVMNYKNQKLMDESMKEIASHKPTLNKMNYIEPDYQVGDQVAAINNNYATMNEIADKVSNPLTAGSILSGAGADRAQRLNEVFGAKNRADDQTHYQQTMMGNQMNAQNTALLNQDSAMKLENRLSLNNAQITLNNTTADNLYTMLQEQNLKEKDRITLTMAIKALNQYGTVTRKLADEVYTMSKGSIDLRDKVKD